MRGLREKLRGAAAGDAPGSAALVALYRCWSHSVGALLSLCFLAQVGRGAGCVCVGSSGWGRKGREVALGRGAAQPVLPRNGKREKLWGIPMPKPPNSGSQGDELTADCSNFRFLAIYEWAQSRCCSWTNPHPTIRCSRSTPPYPPHPDVPGVQPRGRHHQQLQLPADGRRHAAAAGPAGGAAGDAKLHVFTAAAASAAAAAGAAALHVQPADAAAAEQCMAYAQHAHAEHPNHGHDAARRRQRRGGRDGGGGCSRAWGGRQRVAGLITQRVGGGCSALAGAGAWAGGLLGAAGSLPGAV
eukprot:357286-Chlamydomonas_euryale.AAC.13